MVCYGMDSARPSNLCYDLYYRNACLHRTTPTYYILFCPQAHFRYRLSLGLAFLWMRRRCPSMLSLSSDDGMVSWRKPSSGTAIARISSFQRQMPIASSIPQTTRLRVSDPHSRYLSSDWYGRNVSLLSRKQWPAKHSLCPRSLYRLASQKISRCNQLACLFCRLQRIATAKRPCDTTSRPATSSPGSWGSLSLARTLLLPS